MDEADVVEASSVMVVTSLVLLAPTWIPRSNRRIQRYAIASIVMVKVHADEENRSTLKHRGLTRFY